jgi:hypothetical protein
MSLPTESETFAKLLEHLRLAQEDAAMLGHLCADNEPTRSHGWLGISELIKRIVAQVTKLAMRKWN